MVCIFILYHPSESDAAEAIDHSGVQHYFLRAYAPIARKTLGDAYRADNKGGKQPLVIDLYNGLFAHEDGAMENGVGYIRLFMGTYI
jgi:hypothetical protein